MGKTEAEKCEREREEGERVSRKKRRERELCEKGVEELGDLVRCRMEQPPTNYQRGKVV